MSRRYLVVCEIVFVGAVLALAYWLFRNPPPSVDAVAVDIKLPDVRSKVYLEPVNVKDPDAGHVFLVKGPDGAIERLTPEQLSRRVYEGARKTTGISAWMGPTSPAVLSWLALGLMGQILFTGRMVVQWIASERKKKSVVPPLFWWMSLIGSLMLLAYFLWRRDPIALLGQLFGSFIYLRNLLLIYGVHHPEEIAVTKETVAAA